jgi:transforming growth factor-beta-induced protein
MKKLLALLAVALLGVAAAALPATAAPRAADGNIVETAAGAGQFKTLASLLQKAGLVSTLESGTWTVFAPTDAAFKKVPKATLTKLGNDPALLKQVLLYHVVKGDVPAAKVVTLNGKKVTTAAGLPVGIKVAGKNVFLNGSTKVVTADVKASNGTIHVINKVLLPPGNLVQTAADAGQFKTLASLLQSSGLAKTLQRGTWTVFAPTDAAFKKVPQATLDALAADPGLLKSVLLYHVVKGDVGAAKVVKLNGKSVKTVSGTPVKISVKNGKVFVNTSRVVTPDVLSSNGTIHVINKVLIPSA